MFKRKLLVFVTAIVLLNSCSSEVNITDEEKDWLAKNKNLKVALFAYYPPYQFRNGAGDVDGVFIDYLDLIETKIDYKFTKVDYKNWSNLMEDAEGGKIDFILEIPKTKDRSTYLNFYSEIFNSEQMIVTRKADAKKININNLSEYHLVLPKDYGIVDKISTNFPGIKISYEIDQNTCLGALNSGKYDAYIGPKPNSHYHIKNGSYKNLIIASKRTPYNYKPSVAVPKSNMMLSNIIKKADKSITLEEREKIFNNWLLKKSWPIYYQLSFWLSIIFCLGFAFSMIIYYNRNLKREINKRTKEIKLALNTSEENSKIKTNFIQNISHEIRTPMNGILGYSELLKKEDITPQERTKYIDNVVNSGENLVRIIDNILEVSNLQTGQVVINEEVTSLNKVFEDLIALKSQNALKKEIDIIYKNKNQDDFVIIDRLKLIKILTKIINNALTFTFDGAVKISYTKNESNLEIKISDTGIGIAKHDKEAIFDSFFQLENEISNKFSGLGLGLNIAKQNVLILGGDISFTSIENEGTTFFITLPFKNVEFSKKEDGILLNEKEDHTYKILIAEDEEINFLLVNSILSRFSPYNFLITRVENGEDAVAMCREHNDIDLVLMDIRMPILNGYEATRLIKQIRPKLPILAHTAYSSDKDILNAYQAGCDNVICKPINMDDFKKKILQNLNIEKKLDS